MGDIIDDPKSIGNNSEIVFSYVHWPHFRDLFDFYLRSGMTAQEFDPIAGRLTAGQRPPSTGPINVYSAHRDVLLCLPGLDEGDLNSLIANQLAAAATASNKARKPRC